MSSNSLNEYRTARGAEGAPPARPRKETDRDGPFDRRDNRRLLGARWRPPADDFDDPLPMMKGIQCKSLFCSRVEEMCCKQPNQYTKKIEE